MKELLLYGTIKDGQLLIDRREIFDAWLKSVRKPTRVEIVIGPIRRDKTTQQLKYYFGVIIPAMMDTTGYTKEECDGVLKKIFLTTNKNTKKEYIKSKAELSVKEMSEYLDSVIMFLAEIGIWVPCCNEFNIKTKST